MSQLPPHLLRSKALIALSVLLFLNGCGAPSPPTVPPKTFRYAESGTVRSLDPARATTRAERWLAAQLFNTLFEVGEDLNRYPVLVKEHTWSNEGASCMLYLHEKVAFHQPENRWLSARDVVFSLRRTLRLAPELAQKTGLSPEDIQVEGKHQVSLRFPAPSEKLLWWLTDVRFSIVPPEATRRKGIAFGEQPVGTGPFRLIHWYPGHSAKLLRHTNYFRTNFRGHPLPELAGVYVSFLENKQEIERRFREGELDLCWPLQADSSLRNYTFSRKLLAGYFLELDTALSLGLRRQLMGKVSRQALADSLGQVPLRTYWPDFLPSTMQSRYAAPYRSLPTPQLDSMKFRVHTDAASQALFRELKKQLRLRQTREETSQLRLRYYKIPYPDPAFWLLPHSAADSTTVYRVKRADFTPLRSRVLPLLLVRKTGLLNPEVNGLHLDATGLLRLERVGVTRQTTVSGRNTH